MSTICFSLRFAYRAYFPALLCKVHNELQLGIGQSSIIKLFIYLKDGITVNVEMMKYAASPAQLTALTHAPSLNGSGS